MLLKYDTHYRYLVLATGHQIVHYFHSWTPNFLRLVMATSLLQQIATGNKFVPTVLASYRWAQG